MSEEEKQIYVLHRTSKSRLYMIDHSWAIYYYKVTSRTVRTTDCSTKVRERDHKDFYQRKFNMKIYNNTNRSYPKSNSAPNARI